MFPKVAREYKYRKHSSRDFGFVEYRGKRIRFPGLYGSVESEAAFKRWRAARIAEGVVEPVKEIPISGPPTVATMCLLYLDHAAEYYGDNPRGELPNVRAVARRLIEHSGMIVAERFSPRQLKDWLKWMASQRVKAPHGMKNKSGWVGEPLSRNYINDALNRVKRMFRWAVSEELIPVAVLIALETVPGLRRGQWGARETAKRKPASARAFVGIRKYVSPIIADMSTIQWHTGVRSSSLCAAKVEQFECRGKLWKWRPRHKTEHLGHDVVIPIGPRCQVVLAKYLEGREPGDYLFCPRSIRNHRKYHLSYRVGSYRQAVKRGLARANKERPDQKQLAPWTPHQLRHTKGDIIGEQYGEEGAQAHLAHESINATKNYTGKRRRLAEKIAAERG